MSHQVFRFSSDDVPVREVVLYIFNCPAWGIGTESIHVYLSGSFLNFFRVFNSLGGVTLTRAMQNCESLIRISIPLQQPDIVTPNYFIEFYSPSPARIQRVYIGEVTLTSLQLCQLYQHQQQQRLSPTQVQRFSGWLREQKLKFTQKCHCFNV